MNNYNKISKEINNYLKESKQDATFKFELMSALMPHFPVNPYIIYDKTEIDFNFLIELKEFLESHNFPLIIKELGNNTYHDFIIRMKWVY